MRRHPSGAHKLLNFLLYGNYPSLLLNEGEGILHLTSVRKMARLLGTESKHINIWLAWLEDHSYLERVSWSEDRRQAKLKLRRPSNV